MAAVCSISSVSVASAPCKLVEKKTFATRSVSLTVQNKSRYMLSAEKKEQNIALPTSIALIAATVLPEIAEAAQPGVSPSLQNLLYSVIAGGVVVGAIGIAVSGVSVFDPVNRK